ncbi:hypothetical protein [Mycoplasmoides alvi]|uniref:hypothetical protein n=1 Tax=Mycoplasmoides alvi TaxID=78580 RepID=UPI00051BB8AD|nr:hypothetical protein [Mycoplasmoides alvi]
MKKKINNKYLLMSLAGITLASAIGVGIYSATFKPTNYLGQVLNANSTPITSKNFGQQVGKIRHWQNNNFNGFEVRNGGFIVLTGTNAATRIDAFGNILWEFDPSTITTDSYVGASDFTDKKVVEVVEDQANPSIYYLLLVPNQTPDVKQEFDPKDPFFYDQMKGEGAKQGQATLVQISENIASYSGSSWTPSYTILNHLNINPEKMVNNYPADWKSPSTKQGTGSNTFFAKDDHPSWYVTNSSDHVTSDTWAPGTVTNPSDSSIDLGVSGTTMVLPWKQYITNLGNMYANNGVVLIFGGNGSIFNDPEALSIGVWKLNFNTNEVAGIPYAYVLSGISYSPSYSGTSKPTKNWNFCYAPIGQTSNFHYVPRLAVGGIETNVSSSKKSFIYLAAGITVGQVNNSQTRQWAPNGFSSTSSSHVATLREKRSLQLSGQNIVSNPQDPDRNSIDPCLLFGTALNINSLLNMPTSGLSIQNCNNIFVNNDYFDIGTNMSYNSFVGTYYFFDNKRRVTVGGGLVQQTQEERTVDRNNAIRRTFPYDFNPTINLAPSGQQSSGNFPFGSVQDLGEQYSSSTGYWTLLGTSKASFSLNLSVLVDNARNYYYPTLAFGYSLKDIGSLVKVQMPSELPESLGKSIYGYAMQVGKSILFINEPKFDSTSIVYHAPSSVSIGKSDLIGTALYGNSTSNGSNGNYWYNAANVSSNADYTYVPFSSCGYFEVDNEILKLGVGEFVAGIKDFNDYVPYITDQYDISKDPYALTETTDEATNNVVKVTTKKSAQLPWNAFQGLTSANDGQSIASVWSDTNNPSNDKLLLTSKPQLSEFSKDLLWKEFWYIPKDGKSDNGEYNPTKGSLVNTGEKQIWFECVKDDGSQMTPNATNTRSNDLGASGRTISVEQPLISITAPDLKFPANYFSSYDENKEHSTTSDPIAVALKPANDGINIPLMFGQTKNPGNSQSREIEKGITYIQPESSLQYAEISSLNRVDILGQGNFVQNLPDDFLSNSLGSIIKKVPLSTFSNDPSDLQEISILDPQYLSQVFKVTQNPNYKQVPSSLPQPPYGQVVVGVSNIDMLSQKADFTAYSWNILLGRYDVMPNSSDLNMRIANNSQFQGFNAIQPWVMPVAITVPIIVLCLVFGLGLAIGIPMHKHLKILRTGFEMQHQRVNKLTSAVGGVFKKIIDNTNANNMKSKPQMLKGGPTQNATKPQTKQIGTSHISSPTSPINPPKSPTTPIKSSPTTPIGPKTPEEK